MCYSAAQAVGGSICVPACDPNNPATCAGACTESGACLQRCKVPQSATDVEGCPGAAVVPAHHHLARRSARRRRRRLPAAQLDVRDQQRLHLACVHRVHQQRQRRHAGAGPFDLGRNLRAGQVQRARHRLRARLGVRARGAAQEHSGARRLLADLHAGARSQGGAVVQRVPAGADLLVRRLPADRRAGVRARLRRLAVRRRHRLHRRRLLRLGRHRSQVQGLPDLRAALQDRRRLRALRSRQQPEASSRTTPATRACAATTAASSSR